MKVYCEYLTNPVGIDVPHPRFSWTPDRKTGCQAAYRIMVYRDDPSLSLPERRVWDSGLVSGGQMNEVAYDGEALQSVERYWYKVISVDEDGATETSDAASFVTGLMSPEEWRADTLGGPGMEIPAFLFRTSFRVERPVRAA